MVLVTELENTLWGVILNGKSQYEHKSERPVHVSMAALDTSSTSDQYVPVLVQQDGSSYILCTLHAPSCLQQNLNLEINKGETVSFSLNGNGVVHLTGYFITEQIIDEDEDAFGNPDELMQYAGQPHENCDHDHNGGVCGGHDEDDDDDDDENDDDDDDDEDDDGEDGFDSADFDEDADDDDDEDDDEDDDDEPEEDLKANGKKRKLETKNKDAQPKKQKQEVNNKKSKKQQQEDDDDDDEPPQLVKTNENNKQPQQKQQNKNAKSEPETRNLNGIQVKDTKIGNGPEAKKGKEILVYYSGKLKQNGKMFDECVSGKPFRFRLGKGEVIKGWDIGFDGMKVGGKRTLTIPANLAYGNKSLAGIPANSTLVFDVELKGVR